MCGVVGIYDATGDPCPVEVLRRMSSAVSHRGPDDEGIFVHGSVGLGHRRLAIIDPTPAGRGPMQTPDGRFVLAYNGEVYNFQELRVELEAAGHRFRSNNDGEVVLHAFAEWGPDSLPRLNGMFAFAIWDRARDELFLCRDRFGIKPLYYAWAGRTLLFGSEVKALLAHPQLSAKLDPEGLLEYLTFQNFFTERTLFAGVSLLEAGSYLRISRDAREPVVKSYWDFSFREPNDPATPEEYEEELARLFKQAVSRQLVSDVPVSAYLSGGMDSGSIAAVASSWLPTMRTFTIGFDKYSASGLEVVQDEREPAERLSYLLQTEHYEMVLKAGDMERVLPLLVWHLEEPRVGQSYPNFYAAKLASRFNKVTLAGTGGDELFGGYPWRYYRAVVNSDFEDYIDKYYGFWQRLIPNRDLPRVMAPVWNDVRDVRTRDIFSDVFKSRTPLLERPEDYINHSLYFEAKTFLHGLLVVEDKLAMAHGLETRVPFLDNDLVEFAQTVPVSLKLRELENVVRINENDPGEKVERYFQRTHDGKVILRKVMGRYMPSDVTERVKQGFSGPDASWFRGESIQYVKRMLLEHDARLYDYLDRSAVHDLVQEHLDGRTNRRLLIWSLLYLEQWIRVFLDGQRPSGSH